MSIPSTKRMIKRNSTVIFCATLVIVGFTIKYRTEVRNVFVKLRSNTETLHKENVIQLEETLDETESETDDKTFMKFHEKYSSINKKSPIKNVEKIILNVPDSKQLLPEKEISDKCSLDSGENTFANENNDYETLRVANAEIYSTEFLHDSSTVKPVFANPIIRLHPDKFFLPIVMRGPNNQLIGLRESIYVAIRLNRTLVIPRFKKHRTNSVDGVEEYIHPRHRVDFERVCQFISCITIQQFRKACGNLIDVIFRLRHYSKRRIGFMESATGMRFSTKQNREKFNYIPPNPKDKKSLYFGSNEKEIRKLFEIEERCAVYAQPFYNMKAKLKPSKRHITSQKDLKSMKDAEIISEILQRTSAPKYIQNIAKEFIQTIFGSENFLTVHWRYDKKDWMKRCPKLDKNSGRKSLCDEAAKAQPQDVARAIKHKLQTLEANQITRVYIASPPSEKLFIDDVKKLLKIVNVIVYHLEDLKDFLRERHEFCEFLTKHNNDIESTIEMEICTKGYAFLRSTHSSWSSNVIDWRRHNSLPNILPEKDEDILMLTQNSMSERKNS